MILWLDHLIFGNGMGLASPYFDSRFYWLNGQLYTFSHGLGAQLHSFQWFHPKAGERRRIAGREWMAFSSYRRWLRVHVSWALTGLPSNLDEANALLRQIEKDLGRP